MWEWDTLVLCYVCERVDLHQYILNCWAVIGVRVRYTCVMLCLWESWSTSVHIKLLCCYRCVTSINNNINVSNMIIKTASDSATMHKVGTDLNGNVWRWMCEGECVKVNVWRWMCVWVTVWLYSPSCLSCVKVKVNVCLSSLCNSTHQAV